MHKLPNVFRVIIPIYCLIILFNYTLALQHPGISHYLFVSYLFVMQSLNGAQFLNIACLLFLPLCLAALVALAQTTVMIPLLSIYASL